jgi:hypothetical protein
MLLWKSHLSDLWIVLIFSGLSVYSNEINITNEEMTICSAFQAGGMNRLAEFSSPGYPHKYPPNVDCIRVIHAPPNYDIVFRFHDLFRIETSYEDLLALPRAVSDNCPNDYLVSCFIYLKLVRI